MRYLNEKYKLEEDWNLSNQNTSTIGKLNKLRRVYIPFSVLKSDYIEDSGWIYGTTLSYTLILRRFPQNKIPNIKVVPVVNFATGLSIDTIDYDDIAFNFQIKKISDEEYQIISNVSCDSATKVKIINSIFIVDNYYELSKY